MSSGEDRTSRSEFINDLFRNNLVEGRRGEKEGVSTQRSCGYALKCKDRDYYCRNFYSLT